MDKKEEKLKRELIKASKAIKRKYEILKTGESRAQKQREQAYTPITEPLRELLKQSKTAAAVVKKEKFKKEEEDDDAVFKTPQRTQPSFLATEPVAESIPITDDDDEDEDDDQSTESLRKSVQKTFEENQETYNQFLEQYDPLPRQYVDRLFKDENRNIDDTYGIHYDAVTDKWMLGGTSVEIDEADLIIGGDPKTGKTGVRYPGTAGLYELLFMKEPTGFTETDKQAYFWILEQTNVYRKNFEPTGQVMGNKGYKYLRVIKPILTQFTTQREESSLRKRIKPRRLLSWQHPQGYGMHYNEKPLEFVYWNTPSELVDRLRLLWASKMAGNNNHNNEIQSIIEELREENIIH